MTKKDTGIMDLVQAGLGYVSHVISSSIFPSIAQGSEMVFDAIEQRILLIEKSLLNKVSTFIMLWLGVIFLSLAVLFFLIDVLGGNKPLAFVIVGMIFVIGGIIKKSSERGG